MQPGQRVALGLVAQQLHLDPGALEAELELGQLAHRGALDLDAAQQHVVGVLGPAGVAQRGRDRPEDHAARLRHAVAEPLQRLLARGEHVVDAVQRGQHLDLDEHGHAEQVGVGLALGDQQRDRPLGVGEGVVGALGAAAGPRRACSG